MTTSARVAERGKVEPSSVPEITVTALDNGPLIVRGRIRLLDSDGNVYETNGRSVALCRCGASAQKPFCDGSHVRVGFRSHDRVPAAEQVA